MPIRTLLFQRYMPDRSVYDPEASRLANNVYPIRGTYMGLRKMAQAAAPLSVSGSPVESAALQGYAHVYLPTAPVQRVKPLERTSTTDWLLDQRDEIDPVVEEKTQVEVEAERVGTDFFDDGIYMVSPGAASTESLRFKVNTTQEPPDATHFILVRYKVFGADDTEAFTLTLRLTGNAGTIVSDDITGFGEADPDDNDWITYVYTLSAGEMAALVTGDYETEDQAELRLIATIAGSNQTLDPDEDKAIGGWLDENAEDEDLFGKLTDASDLTYVESGVLLPLGGADVLKLGIVDAEKPASWSNLGVPLRWEAANQGILCDVQLFSSGALVAQAEKQTPPASITTETITLVVEDEVVFDNIDWTDLDVGIAPSYPIEQATSIWATFRPTNDVDDGDWTPTPLKDEIDDDSDLTFVTSPTIANTAKSFQVDLEAEPDVAADVTREREIIVRVRNNHATQDQDLVLRIYEDEEQVAQKTFTASSGAGFTQKTWSLDNIQDPNDTISNTGWTPTGATIHQSLDDDTETVDSSGSANDKFQVEFKSMRDPDTNEKFQVRLTGLVQSGGTSASLNLSLYEDTTLLQTISQAIGLDDEEDTYVAEFSEEAAEEIDDFTAVRVEVEVVEAGPVVRLRRMTFETPDPNPDVTDYTGMRITVEASKAVSGSYTMDVSSLKLRTAAARRVRVYETDLQLDSDNYLGVSWYQMQIPEAASGSYVGKFDQHAIIAARLQRLYLVDPQDNGGTVFTDVSKGTTDYTGGSRSWDFESYGPQVIATNYADAVQVFDPTTDTEFADLITSTDKPKARFARMVRNVLVLADLNYSGTPDGGADEVWWSDDGDLETFLAESDLGSDRQTLRQTPGQITAFEGGEFGLLWKRSSLIRMSWIGSPLWFRFDVVTDTIGTTEPGSVVKWGDWFYFHGTDGRFYRTTGHEQPEPIDDGLEYFYSDPQRPERIRRVGSNYPHELQNRVFGDYDRGSKCVWWVYRGAGDDAFENTKVLIYNVIEERWSTHEVTWDLGAGGISALFQLPNVEHDAAYLSYGIAALRYDKTAGEVSYVLPYGDEAAFELETPVEPSDPSGDATGFISAVRPLYRLRDSSTRDSRKNPLRWLEIEMRTWDEYGLESNARTQTLQAKDSNDYGWVECELKGKFVQAKLSASTDAGNALDPVELLGIQVKMELGER